MYRAFLEASPRAKAAAICFILGKIMFVSTAICMLISDTATVISMVAYSGLIFASVVLSLIEGFSKKKKTYKELEDEIIELKSMLRENNRLIRESRKNIKI
tara:strand:- start:244 stop:546 length:303 start_codon:yes stop_codon:yes gene_type:complete